ncbi:unnamed protein product [Lathyrus sativus]|nr:unnamed protein product [Lathyrus sativus]
MEVAQGMHMKGGDGEESYANNSIIFQGNVISSTKLIREEAITSLYSSTLPGSLAIADLGCSCGPNTLSVVSEVIHVVENLSKKLNHSSPEYKVYLNDLAGNDFNSVFRSLDNFKEKLRDETKTKIDRCYFFGVPGSFYGRLFPDRSLHFVHSSYSVHWLSKVPEGIENSKGAIYINETSPLNVTKAYYKQFERDFSVFIKCRAEEIVEGGRMVLSILGRRGDDPFSKESCDLLNLLATALNHMVLKGLIDEDKVNTFNIPNYYPSRNEVKLSILEEGSFAINHVEFSEVDLNNSGESLHDSGYNVAQAIRAVFEPLLVSHFGEAIIDDVFQRYHEIVVDQMSREKMQTVYFTISLTRKAQ